MRVVIDPGGLFAICSHADGSVRLHNLASGQLLWRAWGHREMVTAAAVAPDLAHLLSVSGDGCLFVWRLPQQLVGQLREAAGRVAAVRGPQQVLTQQPPLTQQGPAQQCVVPDAVVEVEGVQAGIAAAGQLAPGFRAQAGGVAGDAAPAVTRRAAWGAVTAPAIGQAATAATAVAAVIAAAGGAAGASPGPGATPGGTSGGVADVSATILRVQQGRPLVSTEKLPKWAQSSPSPAKDGSAGTAEGTKVQQHGVQGL